MLKIIKYCFSLVLIGVLGALLSLTPAGKYLEEEIGLAWLFHLRGGLSPPPDVVIVSIDQTSAEVLHLPDNPENWSRSFFASLVDELNKQSPALIALNVHFGNSRDSEKDALFASTIAKHKNIVLSSYLKQSSISLKPGADDIYSERIIEPIAILGEVALGTAPFPIPKTSSTVKQFWTYKHSAGDIPTFPLSIFQFFAIKQAYPETMQLLKQISPSFGEFPASFEKLANENKAGRLTQAIQLLLSKDSAAQEQFGQLLFASRYSSQAANLLASWGKLLKDQERLYLNYYGDIGAITTIPFYQVLVKEGSVENIFRNKIVLVGYDDGLEPEKQQGFYSVFSKVSGKVISPIEIAATALANILDRSWLKPLADYDKFFLLLAWGALISGYFIVCPYRFALTLMLVSLFAYFIVAWYVFSANYIWLPITIPLLLAVFIVVHETVKYNGKIRTVSAYYLPKEVFAIKTYLPEEMGQYGILKEGVCLATDAGQYTSLSEAMKPLQLHKLMNDYYAVIFPLVKRQGGIISDVVGDAMLAVWARDVDDEKLRVTACRAALEIKLAADAFNQHNQHFLRTRIGLHSGEMRLGNVGAMEHYEYRAVGDTVNTATRIEGLNKLLGTRILASAAVINNISGFFNRDVGTFLLKGKTNPTIIYEIIGYTDKITLTHPHYLVLLPKFAEAMRLFREQAWQEALDLFKAIDKEYPGDGPTCFYINYLQQQFLLRDLNLSNIRAVVIDVGNITTTL